ncbi:MAG: hypothetical protein ACR2QO_00995, partial [Acidimicrobiales bacterium]
LANLDVGGVDNARVAYRFLAERSGTVAAVRPFIVVNTERLGYAAGTGGTVRVSLVADDGAGLPVEDQILAVGEIDMDLVDGQLPSPAGTAEKREQNYPSIPLGGQPIVAGQTYHMVFEQVDEDPVENYVGLDLLYQTTTDLGPRPPVEHWGLSVREEAGGWEEFTLTTGPKLYTPIVTIRLEDGYIFGNGYIEPFPEEGSYRPVDASNSIEVAFELDEAFESRQWWLRARAESGDGSLRVELTGDDGTSEVIEVAATEFVVGEMTWTSVPWERDFEPNVGYRLTLSVLDGGALSLFPLRQGTAYGYEAGFFGGVSRPRNAEGELEGWHKDRSEISFDEADIMMAWTR